MQLLDFLQTVVTTPKGFFLLAASNGVEGWKEHWFEWPASQNEIVFKAKQLSEAYNVYFSSHLFKEPVSTKANVLPSRTIQADLDSADIFSLAIQPTIVCETSPSRFQAFWVLKSEFEGFPTDELERLSCKLTYSIPDCDHSGWSLGHRVRLPDTINWKYAEPHTVNVVSVATRRVDPSTFEGISEVGSEARSALEAENAWSALPHTELDLKPTETVVNLVKEKKLTEAAGRAFNHEAKDRSTALWQFMCECFRANLGRDTVYWLSYNCANNKFLERRYGGVRDLRKDVLRAERHANNKTLDIRRAVHEIRINANLGQVNERLDLIADLLIGYLRTQGSFFHTKDERQWYVPRNTGRPIRIGPSSEWLMSMMTSMFGINSSTWDYRYIVHNLSSYVKQLPSDTEVGMLSYFDTAANSLLLHPSWRDILVISKDSIQTVPNGGTDILFEINSSNEPFKPANAHELDAPWYEVIFDGCFDTITNLTQREALVLATVWFMCILFRRDIKSRPIIAVLGPPGSGKSTFLRKVYMLLYGRIRKLEQLRTHVEFDIAGSFNPLVVYDNLDTWERWLPDRLATSVSDAEVNVRKLYSDNDIVKLFRTAVVGLTAHSPKFIREDVADRLLLFNLSRRPEFADEDIILDKIYRLRNPLWAGIIQDVQKILGSPRPDPTKTPQFRIKDFSTFGIWVTRALGLEADFISALSKIRGGQRDIVLEEEYNLTATIGTWLDRGPTPGFRSPSTLWNILLAHTHDVSGFQRSYKNATFLGKKLWIMVDALKERFEIEVKRDSQTGTRLFSFKNIEKNESEVELNGD